MGTQWSEGVHPRMGKRNQMSDFFQLWAGTWDAGESSPGYRETRIIPAYRNVSMKLQTVGGK